MAPRSARALRIGLATVLLVVTAAVVALVAVGGPAPAPSGDARPVAAFIGDSYTQGDGATATRLRWTSLVSKAQGWREANFGRASTGYASSSSSQFCGRPFCPPFAQMVDQVAASDPAVVVVEGGQSDWLAWQSDSARTTDLIDDTMDTLRRQLPDARIVIVSPLIPPGADHLQDVREIAEQVEASAKAKGFEYVDLLDPDVLGAGGAVADDRFNASDAGHRAIADRVLAALHRA